MKKECGIIIVSLVLILSGCQQLGLGQGKQDSKQTTFVGGTKGLEIAFAEDQPPATVLDNNQESFFMSLLIRNKGEHPIPPNSLVASISGIVQSTFGLRSLNVKNNAEIYGVTKEGELVTPGVEEILEFGEASFKTDLPGDTTYTIRADVCYNYKTKAVTKVCLKKEVLKPDKIGAVCPIVNNNLGIENSGAPMHAESARESTVGSNKAKISFKVVNKDIGAVFQPNTFTDACVGHENDKDQIKVTVNNPDRSFNIECPLLGNSNNGVVKLINKERDITCTISTANMQDITFQDLIIIQLDYMYRQAVITQLRVSSEG